MQDVACRSLGWADRVRTLRPYFENPPLELSPLGPSKDADAGRLELRTAASPDPAVHGPPASSSLLPEASQELVQSTAAASVQLGVGDSTLLSATVRLVEAVREGTSSLLSCVRSRGWGMPGNTSSALAGGFVSRLDSSSIPLCFSERS